MTMKEYNELRGFSLTELIYYRGIREQMKAHLYDSKIAHRRAKRWPFDLLIKHYRTDMEKLRQAVKDSIFKDYETLNNFI